MKTAKQLIEEELQKVVHQLKEVSLLQEEKQALVSYKKELEQLLFLKKLSDTYHLEPKDIEKVIVLPAPSMAFAAKNDDTEEGELLVQEKCKALFQKYCTDKRRAGYRPEGISYSLDKGGTYGEHQIIDSELVTKNKIYLYTQDDHNSQFRFLIIRKEGEWRIDECQRHDGGWIKYGL